MGSYLDDGYVSEFGTDDDENLLPPVRKADCKMIALACETSGLVAIRGYAVISGGYTEHWWNQDDGGSVIDGTGIARVADRLVPLDEGRARIRKKVCMQYTGKCIFKSNCEWCHARSKLERQGIRRIPIAHARYVLDMLFRDVTQLKRDVAAISRMVTRLGYLTGNFELIERGIDNDEEDLESGGGK